MACGRYLFLRERCVQRHLIGNILKGMGDAEGVLGTDRLELTWICFLLE